MNDSSAPNSRTRLKNLLLVFFSFLFAMAFLISMIVVWHSNFRKNNALSFDSKDLTEFCNRYKEDIAHIYETYICDYEIVSRMMFEDSQLPQSFPDAKYLGVGRYPRYEHGNGWTLRGTRDNTYTSYYVAGKELPFDQCLRRLMPEARDGSLLVDLFQDPSGVKWIRFIFDFRYLGDRFEIEFIEPFRPKYLSVAQNSESERQDERERSE